MEDRSIVSLHAKNTADRQMGDQRHPLEDVTVKLPASVAAAVLSTIVSEISERCYCASWMSAIEDAMERIVPVVIATGKAQPYGQFEVELSEALAIDALVRALGGWDVAWDVDSEAL